MHFPSFVGLAARGREIVLRFPWTMAAGVVAAAASIIATTASDDTPWVRVAMVAALGLPLSLALTLLAEERGWTARPSAVLNAFGIALLVLLFLYWPGPDRKHEAIRYFQLNVGLHLLVATLPFLGYPESRADWQYNRRLFQGILRSALFSLVLFIGLAIALAALDQLFGVDVPGEVYGRLYLIMAFVVNTMIFLAGVPRGIQALAIDSSYPRVLKVFAQYVLTPIVFVYLVLLLAYLVKIIAGGEWPSGWIGWLVTSVAVAGLLGFLLVHPLRNERDEAWIRTYTRWLFIGLIPAAAVLLLAFWKRVLPYGLTEPRLLGIVLGVWLLSIAVSYTAQPNAGIRRIPVTLAALLLFTLYGPFSMTSLSVASQGRRLENLLRARDNPEKGREASAALRFLLDHGSRREIAAAVPRDLPPVDWDSVSAHRGKRDSVARQILAVAGVTYVPEYAYSRDGYVFFNATRDGATRISGYDWMLQVSSANSAAQRIGTDSVWIRFDTTTGVARAGIHQDTVLFDVTRLVQKLMSDSAARQDVPSERLGLDASAGARRVRLALEQVDGRRMGDSVRVRSWHGKLFLGRR